jgi:very-short-patch-repair endonuclease
MTTAMGNETKNEPKIETARRTWEAKLIDKSRNNNLLYFRDLKAGTFDLSAANGEAVRRLLIKQEKVTVDELVLRDADAADVRNRLSTLYKRALQNLEEKGLETLYVAAGLATWTSTDGGREASAPVVLLPARIEVQGRRQTLMLTGEQQVNLALLHVLNTEFGCTLTEEALLGVAEGEIPDEEPIPGAETALATGAENHLFTRLTAATRGVPGFQVLPRYVLGNFSFQKMAMLRDIRENGAQIAAHPVLAAIAQAPGAADRLRASRRSVDPRSLDAVPPDAEHLVLDADSSQQRVIAEAAHMQSGVVQGPPGTGKSQTIVNLIAELAAQGKRVLFVAEKRAALQVVKDRMARLGLEHLILDLHGAEVSSREVLTRIAERLEGDRETPAVQAVDVHGRLVEQRARLNRHAQEINRRREPHGRSVYELRGVLLKGRGRPESGMATIWRGADVVLLTPHGIERLRAVLREAAGVADLFLRRSPSPWTSAQITDAAGAQAALAAAQDGAFRRVPVLTALLETIAAELGLPMPKTPVEARAFAHAMQQVKEWGARYALDVFDEDLQAIEQVLRANDTTVKRLWAKLTNGAYRGALASLRRHRRGDADDAALSHESSALWNVLQRWRAIGGAAVLPAVHESTAELQAAMQALDQALAVLAAALPKEKYEAAEWDALQQKVDALARDEHTVQRLPRVRELEREASALKAEPFALELKRLNIAPDDWDDALEYAVAKSALDAAYAETPDLPTFLGAQHERAVQDFRSADVQRTKMAVGRVVRAVAEHGVRARNEHRDEADLVRGQAQRKRGRLSLRTLLARAPNVLTALFPCWMASPLSISQLLQADRSYFDVVIFDEGSQILPEDAVPAIMRARHVIVAGDRHQLPPTTFFASGGGDAAEEEIDVEGVDGYESLLDQMSAVTDTWSLDWHYRSRDEALIAFSNRHVYRDRLITFPSPFTGRALRHELVTPDMLRDGDVDSVTAEVQRVVELVFAHFRERPNETLGVITMGIKHQQRVEAAIERALGEHPELEEHFDTQKPERFFVKNLERVQGDERDAIIISVGYGKSADGRLPYRFGPLNTEGGERRLNVAVTRARSRLTLVSSFSHLDMDPGRSTKRGVELLRLYLEYVASQGRRIGQSQGPVVAPNPFEEDIQRALETRGLKLTPQWGVSGYRIDLVAHHPERPGEFVLAIECDGATYHSAATARDRDRLRQQVLESLGWRFHRIWSTDWFQRREDEIERAVRAYEDAVRRSAEVPTPAAAVAPQPSAQTAASSAAAASAAPERAPLHLPRRGAIDDYSDAELKRLLDWVKSDGRLRDNAELFEAMFEQLPFKQRGPRIRQRLESIIADSR